MKKSLKLKPKRKVTNSSIKVVLPISKRNISKMNEEKEKKKIVSPVKKTPPLYSSTPKPVQKCLPLPIPLSAGQPYFEKELVIVLERVKVDQGVPFIVSAQKTTVKPPTKKQKPQQTRKVKKSSLQQTVLSRSRSSSRQNKQQTQEPSISGCETNITTQIPSEILKNFGIPSPLPRYTSPMRSSKSINPVLIETPPGTSAAGSSTDCDHIALNGASVTSLSDDEFLPDSIHQATSTCAELGLSVQPNLVMSNILEQDGMPSANTSITSLVDPLETSPEKTSSLAIELVTLSTHCELLYGLAERLYLQPDVYNLDELGFSNPDLRVIAPYSLRIDAEEDKFFMYVAPVSMTMDKYCCLVFGVLHNYIIAYGGHFLVNKDRLYDPSKKEPVGDVKLTNPMLCRQHLGLLNIPNKLLMKMENYVPQASHPSYQETLLGSLDIFMSSIDQVRLKEKVRSEVVRERAESKLRTSTEVELGSNSVLQSIRSENSNPVITHLCKPRVEQVFTETCLPITGESLNRVLDNLSSLETLKPQHGELASFIQNCGTMTDFYTLYYAAHEALGCMSFYKNVFVIGYVEDRFVVAVVEGERFFIMATKRVYSRNCIPSPDTQPIKYHPEMLKTINLPLFIPFEHALAILEARQIIRHSYKHQFMYLQIVQQLGVPESPSPTNFITSLEPTSRLEFNSWLKRMLENNFTATFRHSLCQFPSNPSSSVSPLLIVENVTKLWVHQLMRRISNIEDAAVEADLSDPTKLSVFDFFTLDTSTFISFFLPLFGMSDDSSFQCLRLGTDGMPTAVCLESLPARQIGLHVHQCHTLPLLWDENDPPKKVNFSPFSLVFQQHVNPPLSEIECDLGTLSWARSIVERWSRDASQSYIKLLQVIKNTNPSQSEPQPSLPEQASSKTKKVVGGQKKQANKRRYTSGEESSRKLQRHV